MLSQGVVIYCNARLTILLDSHEHLYECGIRWIFRAMDEYWWNMVNYWWKMMNIDERWWTIDVIWCLSSSKSNKSTNVSSFLAALAYTGTSCALLVCGASCATSVRQKHSQFLWSHVYGSICTNKCAIPPLVPPSLYHRNDAMYITRYAIKSVWHDLHEQVTVVYW